MENRKYGTIDLEKIKSNPNNPRTIKKHQLEKLVKSIQDFPEMLQLRPIVVDEEFYVLGGNMRLKALRELKFKEVPYLMVEGLTPEQKKQFVIKDNVNYGDWDWDELTTNWDLTSMDSWGLDIPSWVIDDDREPEIDRDVLDEALNNYVNAQIKRIVLFFSNEEYPGIIKKMEWLSKQHNLESNTDALQYLLEFYGKHTTQD